MKEGDIKKASYSRPGAFASGYVYSIKNVDLLTFSWKERNREAFIVVFKISEQHM